MALYPEKAAELRRLASLAYQSETVKGRLAIAALNVIARVGETGEEITEQEYTDLSIKGYDYYMEKVGGIPDGGSMDDARASMSPGSAVVASYGYLATGVRSNVGEHLTDRLEQMGGPGASNRSALVAYVLENYGDLINATAP